MRRTNIYLNEKQHQKLHEQAEKEGVPAAELVRRAVDAFLLWYDPSYCPTPPNPPQTKEEPFIPRINHGAF
ncbi:hypothetical protein KSB_62330 [Ktedonobacter robiniae]|uniref:Predicted DNA-binding protein ribbon-helix-helix domain-containing protein n=1 Tax=Ktedonobacter robiniae TaxID=2778365 RepID=A0ABQ3UYK1_9CHLR|nr:hypothetical protein KSB_62330 [Ktedonobacter robiniae]